LGDGKKLEQGRKVRKVEVRGKIRKKGRKERISVLGLEYLVFFTARFNT
jgi:hypothetical protein